MTTNYDNNIMIGVIIQIIILTTAVILIVFSLVCCLCAVQVSTLTAVCGRKLRETMRRMMRKLGTNQLWSNYSLAGRKGKLPLNELPVFRLLLGECKTVM